MRSLLALLCGALLPLSAPAAEGADYLRDVKPILRGRCFSCHGALRQKAKLRLDTAALIRKGGRSGPAVVPGKSDESPLIAAVTGTDRPRMPPESEGAALSAKEIAALRAWIDRGAAAPAEPVPEGPRRHWAFQVPTRPALPTVPGPARNPIDAFVAAEHAARGLQAAPPAAPEALLRRVHLDLTGLPPTRAELHAFRADGSPGAYERVVDRLLASPRYGERWGRHWMDVWRYSDWYGRRAVPDWWNSASQIWRWRDWIVRSLNADKGYDRMVVEMLAADEVAPEDGAALVATGYLARNWYALNYNQWMRDTVEHTGKAFLGLTFNCAHCHDHKYDPISQEEYFRFRAFFEPLELRQDRVSGEPDPGPFQKYQYSVLRKPVKVGSIRVFDERADAPTWMYVLGDERNRFPGRPPVTPGAPAFLGGDRLEIKPVALPPAAYYPGLKPFIRQEETARREREVAAASVGLEKARQTLAARRALLRLVDGAVTPGLPPPAPLAEALIQAQAAAAALPLAEARLAAAVADVAALQARTRADDARYGKGAGDAAELARAAAKAERRFDVLAAQARLLTAEQTWSDRRDAATVAPPKQRPQTAAAVKQAEQQLATARAALAAAEKAAAAPGSTYKPLSPIYPATSTGRRRALAGWIASKDNPLTARVAVNHVWARHFGKPLVETVFDFGRNGKPPTHPALLDWLAVEFMDSGWSMKHLHRLIVTSDAYRMASAGSTANVSRDPDNRFLWRFPSRRVEAEVVRDAILHAAGQLDLTTGGPEVEDVQQAASRRRTLYFSLHPEVGGQPQFLELFDAPDPCECYRRTESLVPQQALALTNSRLAVDQGRLLARKLSAEVGGDTEFVVAAFEQVLTRRPSAREQALCLDFLRKQADLFRKAGTAPAVAGAVGPSPDPAVRARESLVRSLFSHNDFITIR